MASFTWQERAGIPNSMTLKPAGLTPLNPMAIKRSFYPMRLMTLQRSLISLQMFLKSKPC